jgi:prevent-host-death family protein
MCYFAPVHRIGVRELRQHASRYLEMVKAGETVEVTERGELVAVLVPAGAPKLARDRLVASGKLLPARVGLTLPVRRVLPEGVGTASDALAEVRAERRP